MNPKIRRPNGLPSISTKARIAVLIQALTALALVALSGDGVTVVTLSPGISAVVTAALALVIKDEVPVGTVVEYGEGDEVLL